MPVDLGGFKRMKDMVFSCYEGYGAIFFLPQQEGCESHLIFKNGGIFCFTAPGVSLLVSNAFENLALF